MICRHLKPIEDIIREKNVTEMYRGQPWSKNCREWVYYDCYIDTVLLSKRLDLKAYVVAYEHIGTNDGQKSGFYCTSQKDGIMGLPKQFAGLKIVIS